MVFSRLSESFTFHSSPEVFISSRLEEGAPVADPTLLISAGSGSGVVRASILNRNVHIISSYSLCSNILVHPGGEASSDIKATNQDDQLRSDLFNVGIAYKELMVDWFPAPNILLEDAEMHMQHKEAWREQVSTFPDDSESLIRETIRGFIKSNMQGGTTLDLYETCKLLAWDLLLGVFLSLDRTGPDNKTFAAVEKAQEALLQGQFSLFPVSVRTPFWQSARSKGLKARKDLQTMLKAHIALQQPGSCPLMKADSHVDKDDIASHCLLFTSSIANKALSSLLTANIMNVFLMPGERSLAELLRSQASEERKRLLKSIVRETERLSPPVVGVMRRVQQDIILSVGNLSSEGHRVPKGHDVWLYFVGAGRDPNVFDDSGIFRFDRYMDHEVPFGFAFGAGPKTCLGADIVHHMLKVVIDELLNSDLELVGEVSSLGVRAWLGWEQADDPQIFARDLKQLPCQRPRTPIMVTVQTVQQSGKP